MSGDDTTASTRAGSWNVKITGHQFDIGDMRRLLREPFQLVAIDGLDYLRIGGVDAADDAPAAIDQASAVVRLINGVLALERRHASPITVEGIVVQLDADGRKNHHVALMEAVTLRVRANGVGVGIGADGVVQPGPEDAASRALSAARRHAAVGEALSVMGSGADDRYYRVWEIIKTDVTYEGVLAMMGCEQKELQRFHGTLNKPRHQRTNGPPPGGPMTSAEIRAFAQRMFDCWLAELDRRALRP